MWKDISDYPNYMVNESGEIYSKVRKKLLKQQVTKFGYARVGLYKNNTMKLFAVHRIVAQAFIPNPNNLPQINHINENKLDNRVENLEWCTPSYNINHGSRNKIVSKKLTEYKNVTVAKHVQQINKDTGDIVKTWTSTREIERELGIPHSNIHACCTGKRKTRKGYIWRYV
jgi:hypothetical protein